MPGQITLKTDGWLRQQLFGVLKFLREQCGYINTMMTELFADKDVTFMIPTHASRTVYNVFTAQRGYTITGIRYTPNVAQGGALTATVVKATGTATPASGTTPMHSAGAIDLNGTAHTVQTITLTGTAANLVLAAGDRIGVVLGGALTTGEGHLCIRMRKT